MANNWGAFSPEDRKEEGEANEAPPPTRVLPPERVADLIAWVVGVAAGVRFDGGDRAADRRRTALARIYRMAHRHILPVQFCIDRRRVRKLWARPELSVTDDEPPLWDVPRASPTVIIRVLAAIS